MSAVVPVTPLAAVFAAGELRGFLAEHPQALLLAGAGAVGAAGSRRVAALHIQRRCGRRSSCGPGDGDGPAGAGVSRARSASLETSAVVSRGWCRPLRAGGLGGADAVEERGADDAAAAPDDRRLAEVEGDLHGPPACALLLGRVEHDVGEGRPVFASVWASTSAVISMR